MSEQADIEEPTGYGPIRGHLRSSAYRRVSHGLFLRVVDEPDAKAERDRDLRAWRAVLPKSARFTHVTGADLLGWSLPKLPEQVPVFAAVNRNDARPRREGLVCSRLSSTAEGSKVRGLPVDAAEEILLRAARDLGVLDLVIMLDSALRLGDVAPDRMAAVLASGRPGVKVLAAAYELSSNRRESATESVLGVFHAAMDIDSEPQVDLFDDEGTFIGRADFLVTGTGWVHEYDGAVHRGAEQQSRDLRRERRIANSRYRRKGFTLDELLNHAVVVMHEVDRDLGRNHRQRRLARWRVLVRESMYDEVGRARIVNRWCRAMGVVQWS